jgi:hypothetical protein
LVKTFSPAEDKKILQAVDLLHTNYEGNNQQLNHFNLLIPARNTPQPQLKAYSGTTPFWANPPEKTNTALDENMTDIDQDPDLQLALQLSMQQ